MSESPSSRSLRNWRQRSPPLQKRDHHHRARRVVEHGGEQGAQPLETTARVDPEDRPQDDLERQRLEARVELDRLAARPARHLALRHIRHEPGEALHALAVEGGQHQLALAQVRPFVEQDHGVPAHHGLEHPRPLTRMEHLWRRREHLARTIRISDVDEVRRLEQADRERVAVARAAALEERYRPRPPCERLDGGGRPRAGRESVPHAAEPTGPKAPGERPSGALARRGGRRGTPAWDCRRPGAARCGVPTCPCSSAGRGGRRATSSKRHRAGAAGRDCAGGT